MTKKLGQVLTLVFVVAAATAGADCMVGDSDGRATDGAGDPAGSGDGALPIKVSPDFTNGWYFYTWTQNIDHNTGLSSSSWTCFLAGAGGSIRSGVGAGGQAGFAGANIESGTWHMLNQPGFTGVHDPNGNLENDPGSSIMCVPTPPKFAPKHWMSWSNGGSAVLLGSASDPNLICGLTSITNSRLATQDNLWWASNPTGLGSGDSAYVFQSGGNWYLGGSGNAEAYATCIDRTPNSGLWGWQYYGIGTVNLLQQNINSTQCFLSGIGGAFLDATYPAGGADGTWINYASSNLEWSLALDNNRGAGGFTAGVTCLQ